MVKKLNISALIVLFIISACEDAKREWDNPYDPRSNRLLWAPDSIEAIQKSDNEIEISWIRKGRAFDGFIIDKKIGTNEWIWQDSLLNDDINSWIDTINLKLLVNNPSLYQYRVYAYADTNTSYRRTIKIQPALPGHPGSVSPYEISYTHEPAKKMTIKYQQSNELDFYRYNIYHSESQDGEKSIFTSIYNPETTVLDTNNFSVLQENWFWVEVEDTTNQKTLGNPLGIPVDSPPIPAVLDSIIYDSKQFVFSWSQSIDNDIGEYVIEQVSPTDTSIVNQSLSLDNNTLSTAIDVAIDNEHYYRVRTSDVWGNNSYSRIRPSSSFQKIVKLDTVTENGNDLIIMNLGPSLPFTQTLANVKSQFPLWIQNGKKIFSFTLNNVGFVINQDGSGLKTISGIKPQDISFNSDQTLALFIGSDDDIYLAYLNEDKSTVRITQNVNNEWYSDPQFIDNDSKILYAQRKHPSNNNIGYINIYYMDLDGKNVSKISNAINEEKFIMPRMSPTGDKIIYLFKNVGLYEIDYPAEERGQLVSTSGGDSIIPELSPFFRNIRWSSDGNKAILWEKRFNSTYNLYLYEKDKTPKLRLFQAGARYAAWNGNEEIIFKYESSSGMYRKNINMVSTDDPELLHDAPWVQLQPRQ